MTEAATDIASQPQDQPTNGQSWTRRVVLFWSKELRDRLGAGAMTVVPEVE